MDPEGRTGGPAPGKSQVGLVIGFFRNSGTDPPGEAIGPFGLFRRFKQLFVKYADD